ncbi:ClbS/DfsB family four-helix bundle protein [Iodobacter ciconiae]|uniref:ClbS/DfsB family four-helix bundle protein n=1 Tax=Iodobacter ciconiae TaxID=2496266 RepID=A0A3S8ZX53_9NEIS|nr:ClbS/DfsB family four-helix bundle protein [Iodobacter ciconiae]
MPAQIPAPGFKWKQIELLVQSFYTSNHNSSLNQLQVKFT